MSTPALDRATEANFDSHQDVALALHDVPKVPLSTMPEWVREQWTINTRRAVYAALHDPGDDVIARALARRWWDRNADDTDLWDDLTEAEQANVIANMNAVDLADAVRAAILGEDA